MVKFKLTVRARILCIKYMFEFPNEAAEALVRRHRGLHQFEFVNVVKHRNIGGHTS